MPTNLLSCKASKVLFALSINNFGAVFSRISGRLQELSADSGGRGDGGGDRDPGEYTDIELIQHIDVDIVRLTKLLNEAISKFRNLKKGAQLVLMTSLEKAIWNWMDNYPNEFTELQSVQNDELTRCCENLFDISFLHFIS